MKDGKKMIEPMDCRSGEVKEMLRSRLERLSCK